MVNNLGKWKEYNEDGTLKAINNYEYGILHGWCKSFFKNGSIEMEGEMKNGQENGKWLYYDSLGTQEAYWIYENGHPIEKVWLKK